MFVCIIVHAQVYIVHAQVYIVHAQVYIVHVSLYNYCTCSSVHVYCTHMPPFTYHIYLPPQGGVEVVKTHKWFKDIDWDAVLQRKMPVS